jgi:hypothetical protein
MKVLLLVIWLCFGVYLALKAPHLHAQLMVFAFGFLMPTGAVVARYFKRKDVLDDKFWWYSHLFLQISGGLLALYSGSLMFYGSESLHARLGQMTLFFVACLMLLGLFRGDKIKHHYAMTPHRRRFEFLHKRGGWLTLVLGFITFYTTEIGLYMLGLAMCYVGAAILFSKQNRWIDTHESIWGKKK